LKKLLVLFVVLAAALLFSAGCGKKPVAEVNGEKISQEQVDRRFEQLMAYAEKMGTGFEGEEGKKALTDLKKDALESQIDEILLFQAAREEGINVSDQETEDFLEQRIKSTFKDDEEYQKWLTDMKMTETELITRVKYQLAGQKLYEKVTGKVIISEETAQDYYQKNQDQWQKVQVSHILIPVDRDKASQEKLEAAKRKAEQVIQKLDQGEDFSRLAQEYSGDPGSASQGGVLDMEFTRNETGLVPEFVQGSFELKKVGDYSKKPVLSQFGFHIIKLDVKKGSFEAVKSDIENQLLQTEKNKVFSRYMEDWKKNSKIIKNVA